MSILMTDRFAVEVEMMDSDEDELTRTVSVANKTVAITNMNNILIAQMMPIKKNAYILVYQEY